MPRITPVHWKVLTCIFEKAGYTFDRQRGSHIVYIKSDNPRSVPLPKHDAIQKELIRALINEIGITRDQYFDYLKDCK